MSSPKVDGPGHGDTSRLTAFDRLNPALQHHVVNTLAWPALRPLQQQAVEPVLAGWDALLLAPTAGGKTEAALFPLLTKMAAEGWSATSVLYVCPLKALLNDLHSRVREYTQWLGRTCDLRHGDIGAAARRRQLIERPDVLLTTPESIESVLVSALYDPRLLFENVRAVVIDEVHAFAGDDRGWHLLAVLERVAAIAGHRLQRIGCSATVGNAPQLLAWLQGSNRAAGVAAAVVDPPAPSASLPEVTLDFVGNIPNAATVISRLHHGEKRLVFADSRRTVEEMAVQLRSNSTETYVSHSSLSLDERRRAESAFAEGRDCVIVSTSTLELGIDVGDLNRVIQIGSPRAVASFLQRLGRTGRRPGSNHNTLFLETTDDDFLRACGLLLLWSEGYVEPIEPPTMPLHLVGQQILGLALQHRRITREEAWALVSSLGMCDAEQFSDILKHLVGSGQLDEDDGLLFIGPAAERRFGRRNFLDLMAVFTAAPQVLLLSGREEIGTVDPVALTLKPQHHGRRVITLAGRSWLVHSIDWQRRRAYAEPTTQPGDVRWSSSPVALSPVLCNAMRRVLLGDDPGDTVLTERARKQLAKMRAARAYQVDDLSRVVARDEWRNRWWTWAGLRANARWVAAFDAVAPNLLDEVNAFDNLQIALRGDATAYDVAAAERLVRQRFGKDLAGAKPLVDDRALRGLKFNELLPEEMARSVLRAR